MVIRNATPSRGFTNWWKSNLMFSMAKMREQDIRRKNLKRYMETRCEGSPTKLANAAHKPVNQIQDMLAGRKSFGEKVAREIEDALGLEPKALDVDRDDEAPVPVLYRWPFQIDQERFERLKSEQKHDIDIWLTHRVGEFEFVNQHSDTSKKKRGSGLGRNP